MADSSIAVTAGSGTIIDTRTESTNGNHRQVVILGDPATNAGVAPVDATKGLAVDLTATGANTNKLLVTPDLPSGASTSAKQPALGTAGTASTDVITVQGIAAMTPLLTSSSVTAVVPGTAATNLGKAKDSTPGATDTGVATLAELSELDGHTTLGVANYSPLSMTHYKELRVRDQRTIQLADLNSTAGLTILGNDTGNLASSTNHVFGSAAVTFDKLNGAANTVFAGVSAALANVDMSHIFEAGGFVGLSAFLPSLTNVVNVFLRIGTNSTNYNAWTWPVASLTAGTWLNLRTPAAQPDSTRSAGNGWNTGDIVYVAFGVEYATQTNTATGLIFDHIHVVGGRVTASDITSALTSTVNTPNINIQNIAGTAAATNNGTASGSTLRVTVASDSTGILGATLASGAVASGAVASGAVASGAFAAGAISDGADVTVGAKADDKSTATDTTPVSLMSVIKEISAKEQAPATSGVEDAAETAGGLLTMVGSVRRDTPASSSTTTGDNSTLNTDANGALWVDPQGPIAHDTADTGNPIKIGARAITALSGATLVASADRTDLLASLDGALVTRPNSTLADIVTGNASNTDGASTQCLAASGDAAIKTYLTDITLVNTSATMAFVDIKDDSTVKWTVPVPATGGATLHFTSPLPGTANKAWNFDPSAGTTTIYCSMAGFKSKA